jgi:hypothetical protein
VGALVVDPSGDLPGSAPLASLVRKARECEAAATRLVAHRNDADRPVGAAAPSVSRVETQLVIGLWFYRGSLASASLIGRAAMAR